MNINICYHFVICKNYFYVGTGDTLVLTVQNTVTNKTENSNG